MIVRTAGDLKSARGTLEDESSDDIDLVLVDQELPGLDLPAFVREVRERSRAVRVVLLAPIGARRGHGRCRRRPMPCSPSPSGPPSWRSRSSPSWPARPL